METGNHTLVKHLKTDPEKAPLNPADRAMIDFALKLTREPSSLKRDDVELLRQNGFGEEQVLDVVLITCTFNFMDRLADSLGVELDAKMQQLVDMNADKG